MFGLPTALAPFGGLSAAHDILAALSLQIQQTLAQPVTAGTVTVPSDRILAWRRALERAIVLIIGSLDGLLVFAPIRSIFSLVLGQLLGALLILGTFRFPLRDPIVLLRVPVTTLLRLLTMIQIADSLILIFLAFVSGV